MIVSGLLDVLVKARKARAVKAGDLTFKPMPPQGIARIAPTAPEPPVQSEPHGSAAGGDPNPSDEVRR
jgi:hypothetical protein